MIARGTTTQPEALSSKLSWIALPITRDEMVLLLSVLSHAHPAAAHLSAATIAVILAPIKVAVRIVNTSKKNG